MKTDIAWEVEIKNSLGKIAIAGEEITKRLNRKYTLILLARRVQKDANK